MKIRRKTATFERDTNKRARPFFVSQPVPKNQPVKPRTRTILHGGGGRKRLWNFYRFQSFDTNIRNIFLVACSWSGLKGVNWLVRPHLPPIFSPSSGSKKSKLNLNKSKIALYFPRINSIHAEISEWFASFHRERNFHTGSKCLENVETSLCTRSFLLSIALSNPALLTAIIKFFYPSDGEKVFVEFDKSNPRATLFGSLFIRDRILANKEMILPIRAKCNTKLAYTKRSLIYFSPTEIRLESKLRNKIREEKRRNKKISGPWETAG